MHNINTFTIMDTHTHTRTHARTHARTHTRTHARTHARHARTHTHTVELSWSVSRWLHSGDWLTHNQVNMVTKPLTFCSTDCRVELECEWMATVSGDWLTYGLKS